MILWDHIARDKGVMMHDTLVYGSIKKQYHALLVQASRQV